MNFDQFPLLKLKSRDDKSYIPGYRKKSSLLLISFFFLAKFRISTLSSFNENPMRKKVSWTSNNVRQKIKLCPTKAASQRTQLSGVTELFFVSYRRPKTQKHSVSIGLSCSGFTDFSA